MASLLPQQFSRITTANGTPISGGKLKIFDAGTSNLATVYTTAAAAVTAANPIISDSAGILPQRYLADGTYDFEWLTANDVRLDFKEDIVIAASGGGGGGGGFEYEVQNKISNYTITTADVDGKIPVFRCDASGIPGGELILTASAADLGVDAVFYVINTGATGTIRVQPDVGETIDNESDVTLTGMGRGAGYVCVGAAGWETISTTAIQATKVVVSATPATDQTDFTVAGLEDAVDFKQINLAPTASINFNSVAGISEGERLVIANTLDGTGSLGRIIILPHEHAASTAANRFFFADRMPQLLLPGESLEFVKYGSRLRLASKRKLSDCFDVWSDCYTTAPYLADTSSGVVTESTVFGDTTQKDRGTVDLHTSTSSTGGAALGARAGSDVAPAQGQALFLARLYASPLSSGAQEYSIRAGFHDAQASASDVTDGVYWEYLRTAAVQWSMNCAGAGSRSKTATGVTVDTNYAWLGIYITGDWSRADFFISQDGRTYTFPGSQSGANMPTATELCEARVTIKKSVGTTAGHCTLDIQAHRYDTYRGAA